MPPALIIAGAAVVGAGASLAAASTNAGAASDAAATNAAAITSNQAANTQLIDAQQAANTNTYDQAQTQANGDLTGGAAAANDILRGYNVANQGDLTQALNSQVGAANSANTANQANADTLSSQGQGLFQGTVDRGNAAGTDINALLGIGGDATAQTAAFNNWLGSTGYNFTLQQGENAASSNAATAGLLNSGGTLKALDTYGQNTAQTYFGNYLTQLQGQQSTGLSAANSLSGVYTNVANLKNTSNTNTANTLSTDYGNYGNGLVANNNNTAGALANVATGTGTGLANVATGTASNLANSNTSATNNLVSGNTAATGALVSNTNNALSATTSSNNAAANSISGLAGNLAGSYGLNQGLSSYSAGATPTNTLSIPAVTVNSSSLGAPTAAQTAAQFGM